MCPGSKSKHLIVQIDGFSRQQFELALKKGELPFLHSLQANGYMTKDFYSGLPSTTPAVQGELFYGQRTIVPAFCFFDKESAEVVKLYNHQQTQEIEEKLALKNMGILKNGAAFFDTYSGGASDAFFCISRISELTSIFSDFSLKNVLYNSYSWLRTFVLIIIELFLAVYDALLGLWRGRRLIAELKFIPLRVIVVVLFRELAVIMGKSAISQGVTPVHINLLGYDEQSHRRGPSSKFAHWTLRGIDDAIKRIWMCAQQVEDDYHLLVYSDHGQEDVLPYEEIYGKTINEAIAEVLSTQQVEGGETLDERLGIQGKRSVILGGPFWGDLFSQIDGQFERDNDKALLTALGPLGHIYLPENDEESLAITARILVERAHIPIIMMKMGQRSAKLFFNEDSMVLPKDSKRLAELGVCSAPWLIEDLIGLCQHEKSGDLIISGWKDNAALSFSLERGAHGGPGAQECNGFVFCPEALLKSYQKADWLRPNDLRNLILKLFASPRA